MLGRRAPPRLAVFDGTRAWSELETGESGMGSILEACRTPCWISAVLTGVGRLVMCA